MEQRIKLDDNIIKSWAPTFLIFSRDDTTI